MSIKAIYQKIDKTVKKYGMLNDGDTVVIGVSGGADSMLLLSYFLEKRKECKVIVANVEHGIRGEVSVKDSEFVEAYCKENNIEFHCLRINAPQEAKNAKMGVEEYSRKRRYEFFEAFGADKIATAHSLSDNAETFIFRLSRGMSCKGACCIPAVRDSIIRPLIECTSAEIREACREGNIPFVVDETNSDNTYSRNFIRNEIIPAFTELNQSFEAAVGRYVTAVNEQEAFIEKCVDVAFEDTVKDGAVILDKLALHDVAIQKRILMRLYPFDEEHLTNALALIDKPGRCQLSDELYVIADSKTLRIARLDETKVSFIAEVLTVNYHEYQIQKNALKDKYAFCCDCDKICGKLQVRNRKEGDSIRPDGRDCTKSLKKLYNELRIPVENRMITPVICDDNGVIGVYGYALDERVNIDGATKKVCFVSINTEDNN